MGEGSSDNLPEQIPLSDIEIIQKKYGVDGKAAEAVSYLVQNIPLERLDGIFGSSYFLRKLIPICEEGSESAKLRALDLLGKYLGLFNKKPTAVAKKVVVG